jgi:hypothetical protein
MLVIFDLPGEVEWMKKQVWNVLVPVAIGTNQWNVLDSNQ